MVARIIIKPDEKYVQDVSGQLRLLTLGPLDWAIYADTKEIVNLGDAEVSWRAMIQWVELSDPRAATFHKLSDEDPSGDTPLLAGERTYQFDVVNKTYTVLIGGEPWRNKIDTAAVAEASAEQAAEAAKQARRTVSEAGFPYANAQGETVTFPCARADRDGMSNVRAGFRVAQDAGADPTGLFTPVFASNDEVFIITPQNIVPLGALMVSTANEAYKDQARALGIPLPE